MEKEMAIHSFILDWQISWTEEATVHGVAKSWTRLSNYTITTNFAVVVQLLSHIQLFAIP